MMVGCGGSEAAYVRQILQQQDTTEIALVCEPAAAGYELLADLFDEGRPDAAAQRARPRRAARPRRVAGCRLHHHARHHYHQTEACMEAGLNVLLEKPMVMNQVEAENLIAAVTARRRLLSVAFNGWHSRPRFAPPSTFCAAASWATCSTSRRRSGRTGGRSPRANGGRCLRSRAAVSCSTRKRAPAQHGGRSRG
ncbi:MAG: Gfo/Idh/MocA family oxidoreductase [Caldilineaceae bacterium]